MLFVEVKVVIRITKAKLNLKYHYEKCNTKIMDTFGKHDMQNFLTTFISKAMIILQNKVLFLFMLGVAVM